MRDTDTDRIIRRRRDREAARRRQVAILAGLLVSGLAFVAAAGLMAYVLWPRKRVVVAVGDGGAVVAVAAGVADSQSEPSEQEWADLLNHKCSTALGSG